MSEQIVPKEVRNAAERQDTKRNQQEYMHWRRSQYDGAKEYDVDWGSAIEPARANLWIHATSLEGATQALSSGHIKSARKVLEDGGTLAHAPTTRLRKPAAFVLEGLTLNQMTDEQKRQALAEAPPYIAGVLGKALEKYTPDPRDTSKQAAFVFPLEALRRNGLRMGNVFTGNQELSPTQLERAQMELKYLPNKIFASETGGQEAAEISLGTVDGASSLRSTQLAVDSGILLVREDLIVTLSREIRERMQEQGKSQEEINRVLDRIVGFDKRFLTVDEAVGWLANSEVGQKLLHEKTGIDISQLLQAQTKPEKDYILGFIEANQWEIENIQTSEQRQNSLPDENFHLTPEEIIRNQRTIEFRTKIIQGLQQKQELLSVPQDRKAA